MEQVSSSNNPKYTVPEPRSAVVRRQRLVDFLHQNVDQPLQLICAPAGYGKTTLMADFATDTEITVCWFAVDELDRDPRSFATSLFEALQTRFPSLENPAQLLQGMSQEANADWRTMIHSLVDGISRRIPEYFVFVIDDFHIISSSPEVREALDLVLQRLPDNCRIILSTRELPQIASLPRLISQRKVAGLGTGELKFTADEIKVLLKKQFELEVSDEEARRMEVDSEGWITAILLTTHTLWKGLFQEVLNKQGENTFLYEYMASEVFSQQPQAIQDFLLATSILNEFDADFGGALTGLKNADELLRDIEGRNLFVTRIEGQKPWYRYHHLFRDFLRDKMATEFPKRHLELYAKAADYHKSKGDARQSIPFNIQGQRYDEALDQLEEEVESLAQQGLSDTIGSWLEQIPEELRENRPRLLLHFANYYVRRGRNDEAIQILSRIIEVFRETSEHVLESRALMRRSVALRTKGATQMAVRDAKQALAVAREHGTVQDQADAHSHLGRAYGTQGKFPRAEKELKLALAGYEEDGDLFQLSHTNGILGLAYTEMGDFSKAVNHYALAVQGWQQLGNEGDLALTLGNMSCLYYEQGRYKESLEIGNESLAKAKVTNNVRTQSFVCANIGDVLRELGEYEDALGKYDQALALARDCTLAPMISYCTINSGETYRLMGEKIRAKALLKEGLVLAHELDQEKERGLAYTSLGIIESEAQNAEEGITLLDKACELLARAGQKRSLALARFHMAHVFFQMQDYKGAIDNLRKVAALCDELGHVRFLVEDAKNAALMVQYAEASDSSLEPLFAGIRHEMNRSAGETSDVAPVEADGKEDDEPKSESIVPKIEVKAFGQTRIYLEGNPILNTAWGTTKAREMFLYLLHRGGPVSKNEVIEALWPQVSTSKSNSNFHSTLHRMKSALRPDCVEVDGEHYQLNPTWEYALDLRNFRDTLLHAESLAPNNPERARYMTQATESYKVPVLEDLGSAWCNQLRTDLESVFWKAITELSDNQKDAGDTRGSIAILEKALEIDEYQEDIYQKIIDLYIEAGDSAAASRTRRRRASLFGETVNLFFDSPQTKDSLP